MLSLFTGVMDGLNVYPDHMRENLDARYGLVFSQRVLLALIETGHEPPGRLQVVQRDAMEAWRKRTPFLDLLLADPDVTSRLPETELRGLFDYAYYVRNVGATFERLGL